MKRNSSTGRHPTLGRSGGNSRQDMPHRRDGEGDVPRKGPLPSPVPRDLSLKLPIEAIIQLTFAREQTRLALRDLLAMFDRRDDHGWTYAEVARLEQIRKLAGA